MLFNQQVVLFAHMFLKL